HGVKPQHTLADKVDPAVGAGPPAFVVLAAGAVAGRGDVVAQGIPPDIDHLARITGHGDAPAAGASRGTRGAEVLEAAGDEAEYLIAPCRGLDPQPARADQVAQLAGVAG